jgi:hypothetical protein
MIRRTAFGVVFDAFGEVQLKVIGIFEGLG